MSPFYSAFQRRTFLYGLGAGLGTVALNALLAEGQGKKVPQGPHHSAKAKSCIFIYLAGGPSHMDTFDPKPKLEELDGQEFKRSIEKTSSMFSGQRRYVGSPFPFRQVGQAGMWMSEPFQALAEVSDELCLYRGCQTESINHPTANLQMNTGSRFGGEPAIGSWVNYGLGTSNRNLPGFFVLPDVYVPQGGTGNWSNGYLPAHLQATVLRNGKSPMLDLARPQGISSEMEEAQIRYLSKLEKRHQNQHPEHKLLESRMLNYELAFRMQEEIPEILDLSGESKLAKEGYGLEDGRSDQAFARRLLLARRLVEKGVRFVQAYSVGWDSHDDLKTAHANRIRGVDRPIAGLIRDLKERGLLDSTLVVVCGEFGRSPDNAVKRGRVGRDHNPQAMNILLAGGGVASGKVIGATDEIGEKAVEVVHPLRDFHVTLLHLLGIDDNRLTYFHGGRFRQLSQVGGQVIRELVG